MTDNKKESREAPATAQLDGNKSGQKQQNQSQGDSKPTRDKPSAQQK